MNVHLQLNVVDEDAPEILHLLRVEALQLLHSLSGEFPVGNSDGVYISYSRLFSQGEHFHLFRR